MEQNGLREWTSILLSLGSTIQYSSPSKLSRVGTTYSWGDPHSQRLQAQVHPKSWALVFRADTAWPHYPHQKDVYWVCSLCIEFIFILELMSCVTWEFLRQQRVVKQQLARSGCNHSEGRGVVPKRIPFQSHPVLGHNHYCLERYNLTLTSQVHSLSPT